MPEHILSLSYGKDSLACLGAIEELDWPLDRIVHAEVWATDTIPADLPPMVEFKAKADKIIRERWGIEVEHIREKYTYQDVFYKHRKSGKAQGQIHGFPMQRGAWCNDRLKTQVLDSIKRGCISYIGIAADEPKRIARHINRPNIRLPLVELGWEGDLCGLWCKYSGLLSPTYETSARGGCWFCHNQGVGQLRLLRKNYPELWALMLKWDTDSPVTFKADGHTVHDYDHRFALEDAGLLSPDDKVFRWSMLDDELNYRMEEFR